MPELTQERLKELLHYDPDTGLFTRLVSTSSNARKGDIAGSLHTSGYIHIKINGKVYKGHRLAFLYMKCRWPTHEMDHIDHIKDNNRWANICEATRTKNLRNQSMYANNSSGHMGVHWYKAGRKWKAGIRIDGKRIHLGTFTDINDAITVRQAANIKYGFHANHGSISSP